jgi:SAM-dependent methyltransferase
MKQAKAKESDLLGTAISDYYHNTSPSKLWVHDTIGPKVEMKVKTYFRTWPDMPEMEKIALQESGGKVLDIGAGAGSHALELQERGIDVTALDISPLAVQVMKERGVKKALHSDVFQYKKQKYHTFLLLMNGIGLTSTIAGLRTFLQHARSLLNPGGQLLFDSSDIAFMYEEVPPPKDRYYGEFMCRYAYKRQKTDWFTWLYIDFGTLAKLAKEEGFHTDLLFEDDDDQYLVRLKMK